MAGVIILLTPWPSQCGFGLCVYAHVCMHVSGLGGEVSPTAHTTGSEGTVYPENPAYGYFFSEKVVLKA